MGQKTKKHKPKPGTKKPKPNPELQEYMEDWLRDTDSFILNRLAAYLCRDLPFEEKVESILDSLHRRLKTRREAVEEAKSRGFVYPPPVPDAGRVEKTKGYLVSRSW